ncbi:MAG: flagellar biosynthesis anti-sigma factor FlgM [Thiobacillaceae bacterium]|nr:flagellar biosynthesis anti-sigma factor FlgM [Thiobacillaceae bacterium]MCX7673808.1 flagellar biosynthesis anti-sigma factor FlgM [Thiobacillaceae bacterium]MDW8323566.1 flagellar biosynthesis anti-sigma factor FlgM [Burkholderiales bacterium]
MKIDNNLKGVAGPPPKAKLERGKTRTGEQERGVVQDSVELTDKAGLLSSLEAALNALPDSDVNKVEAVRQAIAEGSFKVDEEVVAEKLVEQTLEQLQHAGKPA